MSEDVRIPDIEVVVGGADFDVACFCFYGREDIHQGYDIAAAVSDKDARAVVRQILQDCLTALNNATWVPRDVVNQTSASLGGEPPF